MTDTLDVAAVQFEARALSGPEDFAAQVDAALDAAAGARLVVFPELMTTGFGTLAAGWRGRDLAAYFAEVAEHTDLYLEVFGAAARARDQVVLAGSHLVAAPGGFLNVAHLFHPDGRVVRHEKTLLFPAERQWRSIEGERLTTAEVDGVTVGFATCYEAEIPEVTTALARRGAEVLLVPSATFTEAGFHRVRHCAAARCIENQVYAVHASTFSTGLEPLVQTWARSSVLGPCDAGFPPDGILAEAKENVPDVITARLDLALLQENRRSGAAPTVLDRARRADLFASWG
ncbi:carbon-nitrogen hydrolase family protein [Pseudonocardia yuanmonensis]|uniref:Carbon-nitrogen hydrolase family protein n=1 Tax=Pseudonocardia yuanmonensis TaxID=1095914 RepID=A0ABP8X840_9PSEU